MASDFERTLAKRPEMEQGATANSREQWAAKCVWSLLRLLQNNRRQFFSFLGYTTGKRTDDGHWAA